MQGKMRNFLVYVVAVTVTLCGPGCPRTAVPTGSITKGRVTVLLGAASKSLAGAVLKSISPNSVVAADEIYSLSLTVTEISLDQDGEDNDEVNDDHGGNGGNDDGDVEDSGDDKHDGGGDVTHGDDGDDNGDVSGDGDGSDDEQGGDDDSGEDEGDDDSVVIFQGSQDIDLVSLDNLSQVFSTNSIPAGTYHGITLKISNPRLRLASDPNTEITDIHLTCNDHLFINADFEIPEGGNSLIKLTFNGVHLIREGNGSYVLTPQLDASITVTDANVTVDGAIASVDSGASSFTVTLADGDVTVLYGGAGIFLPADTDTPTGTAADLTVGATVNVVGTIDADGVVTATEIHVT